ncbi:MAG: methyltransferase domain-containing protein, partial [Verrucomicrobiaceae bacterium]
MNATASNLVQDVRAHYDLLSPLYRWLWGEHIHHGYWEHDEPRKVAQTQLIARLAARAEITPGSRVLDIGCGIGGSSLWLARELGCEVLGITISPAQRR